MHQLQFVKKSYLIIGIGIVFALSVGIAIGYFIHAPEPPTVIHTVREPNNGYSFVNPILYTEVPEDLSFPKYTPLNTAISAYVKNAEAQHHASDIGVYYRDLDSNNWVGTNYKDQFDAASMLKVTTLIALLHASESSPSILAGGIAVPANVTIPSTDDQDFFPPVNPVTSGKTYAIKDLMDRLIIQSDNGANALLINFLGGGAITQVFTDLNIPTPSDTNVGVSPQEYSHLFRTIYNATYLTAPDSEAALKLLSQTTFTQGLVAGVPTKTVVAHKFGESTLFENGTTIHELHDCGIVYYPSHPYFLCIMTRGTDFPTLAGIIRDLSNITWQQVSTLSNTK